MKRLIVYVHGKGGSAQEAEHYKSLFPKDEVIGFDYRSQTPWQAKKEFFAFFTEQRGRCEHLTLVANSIGAFFALSSLDETLVDRIKHLYGAFFLDITGFFAFSVVGCPIP